MVAIIGANGAGKSTFLKALTGLVKAPRDAVRFDGEPIGGAAAGRDRAGRAWRWCPKGGACSRRLSVEENLLMGAFARPRAGRGTCGGCSRCSRSSNESARSPATALSGGQQQMVAIGRALMSNPSVLLCDELSLGLAPIVIKEIYDAMPAITREGMSVVIVEQDVGVAQRVSQRVYCFQEGRVSLEGPQRRADARADQPRLLRRLSPPCWTH